MQRKMETTNSLGSIRQLHAALAHWKLLNIEGLVPEKLVPLGSAVCPYGLLQASDSWIVLLAMKEKKMETTIMGYVW